MKKFCRITVSLALLTLSPGAGAQSFVTQADTVKTVVENIEIIVNDITNKTPAPFKIKWRVRSHDFPQAWAGPDNLAICDNAVCRTNVNNNLLSGKTFTSLNYQPGVPGAFHLQLDLAGAPTGTHFLVVNLTDGSYEKDIVFYITHLSTNGLPSVSFTEGITIFPNPSGGRIQLQCHKEIYRAVVYDVAGKQLQDLTVGGSSGVMDLALPAGLYIIRCFGRDEEPLGLQKVFLDPR